MYELWHDYIKRKYSEKAKLCYIDTDSFIIDVKTDDIYQDIAEDVGTRFDRLCGKSMKKNVELRAKTYSYLIDDSSEDKKAESTKKCVIKRKRKFEDYKNCLKVSENET